MKMEEIECYRNVLEIIDAVYSLEFPKEEEYMLRSQFVRAVHSILLNYCEGFPFDIKQKKHFYKLAIGSAYESKACCEIYQRRIKKDISYLYEMLDKQCAMLYKLIEYWDKR